MSHASGAYVLSTDPEVHTPSAVQGEKGDIVFPEEVRGWSDVLDCRHAPYTEKSIEELKTFARHVHKFYLLLGSDHPGLDGLV